MVAIYIIVRLLVTGGAGFIGSNFIHYWLTKYPEDEIVNLDKLTYAGNLENLKDIENDSRYTFVQGNICDANVVDKVMEDIDVVVHFAADSHVDRSILDPTVFICTNVLGTQVLLDSALKHKVFRFHQVSTDEVFGALPLDTSERFTEKTAYNPRNPYSASKAAADHLVRSYFHTFNLPVIITNCSNNFGPYQFPEKMIPLFITNLLENKKVPLYGDGLFVRDWLYVVDHCRAIDLVLKKGKVGETYLVGGQKEREINNLELTKMILGLMGKDESFVEHIKDRPGHDRRYSIDWSKINRELGWAAQYDFKEALQKTIDWYKENENWWRRVKSGEYQKYYQKQYGDHS